MFTPIDILLKINAVRGFNPPSLRKCLSPLLFLYNILSKILISTGELVMFHRRSILMCKGYYV